MMQQFAIRPIRPTDAADLHAAMTHPLVIAQTGQMPTLSAAALRQRIEQGSDRSVPRLVAEIGGRVVGSASLQRSSNPRRAHGAALALYVHPDYWRQGIAAALLAAVLDAADNWLHILRVELDVFADNGPARALYERFGFVTEGVQRDALFGPGGWRDNVMMARLRTPTYAPPLVTQPLPAVTRVATVGEVVIRPKQDDDGPAIVAIMQQPAVARTVALSPYAEWATVAARFGSRSEHEHTFVAEVDGQLVGNIDLYHFPSPRRRHAGAFGMSVAPAYWGHGIGSRLMSAMLDLADNWLNLRRIELEVNTDNPAAIHLYEKFGFEQEGTKRLHIFGAGRFADSQIMARLRRP